MLSVSEHGLHSTHHSHNFLALALMNKETWALLGVLFYQSTLKCVFWSLGKENVCARCTYW